MEDQFKIVIRNFEFYYGSVMALKGLDLSIRPNQIFAVLGPARSGKPHLLSVWAVADNGDGGVGRKGHAVVLRAPASLRGLDSCSSQGSLGSRQTRGQTSQALSIAQIRLQVRHGPGDLIFELAKKQEPR